MTHRLNFILVFLTCCFCSGTFAFTSGLETIALNPVKPEMAVAGQMKNIVILDKATFAVLHKIEIGEEIQELAYSADGSVLIAHTDYGRLVYFDANTLKEISRLDRAGKVEFSPELDLIAVSNYGSTNEILLYSMKTNTLTMTIALGVNQPEIFGFDAINKEVLVYCKEMEDKSEPEFKDNMIPDNTPYEGSIYIKKKYDQKKAVFCVYSLADGKNILTTDCWYSTTSSFATTAFGDGSNYYVNGWDDNIMQFNKTGLVDVTLSPNSYCYGTGYSIKHQLILSDEYIFNYKSKVFTEFEITEKRDWMGGYLHDYVVDTDGIIYGVDSKYLIFKLNQKGEMLKQQFIDLPFHLVVSYVSNEKKNELLSTLVTYTGKTEAELLPLIDSILEEEDTIVFTTTDYAKVAELDKILDDNLDCSTAIIQE